MKVHLHDDQFDGHPHPWCGRGDAAVASDQFEATSPELRCSFCDREWFPNGQPDWHLLAARAAVNNNAGNASGATASAGATS